jgi:photosystem II stability/assembly factor-like uncharacterized protein
MLLFDHYNSNWQQKLSHSLMLVNRLTQRFLPIACVLSLLVYITLLGISCAKRTQVVSNEREILQVASDSPRPLITNQINSISEDKEPLPLWYSASFIGSSAWIATSKSGLMITYDGGLTWHTNLTDIVSKIRCLTFVTAKEGFALDSDGAILNTSDAGLSWQKISSLPFSKLDTLNKSRLKFGNQNEGILVLSPGSVWKTTDKGMHWQELHPFEASKGIRCALTGGASIEGENIWLTAEPGILFKSNDSGKTWSFQKIQNSEGLFYDVFFVNENMGWVTGFPSLGIFRTDNSGVTWKAQLPFNSSSKSIAIISLYFLNDKEGWAVGQDKWGKNGNGMGRGAVLHTIDGGQSWKQVQVGKGDSICYLVYFTDINQGWIVDKNKIYHTSDHGVTWVLVKSLLPAKN